MPLPLRPVLALAALALLGGCASVSKEQCVQGDWYGIGYSDGVAGYPATRLGAHRRACAEVGIIPDARAWEDGRRAGLRRYCTPDNAYRQGKNGRRLSNVCPRGSGPLHQANEAGLRWWELGREIAQTRHRLREVRRELHGLPRGPKFDHRRRHLHREARRLEARIDHLEHRRRRWARY